MLSTRLIVGAALVAFATAAAAATKSETRREAKPAAKRLTGKQETLACRLGTEDRHARIAVVTIGGRVDSFAYYSKWKPRTCSIYLQRRGDMYSKWADSGDITTVDVEKGAFLVEHRKNEYHFIFRNVDRERYCGMDGMINGTLTIRKGSDACELGGDIMVEGTPLGQAFAHREEQSPEKAPVGLLPVTPQEAAKAPPDRSPPATPPAPEKAPEQQGQPAAAPVPAAAAAPTEVAPAATSTPAAAATVPASTAGTPEPAKAAEPVKTADPVKSADPVKTAEPAKAAAPSSGGGIRSFFRSLTEGKGPQANVSQ